MKKFSLAVLVFLLIFALTGCSNSLKMKFETENGLKGSWYALYDASIEEDGSSYVYHELVIKNNTVYEAVLNISLDKTKENISFTPDGKDTETYENGYYKKIKEYSFENIAYESFEYNGKHFRKMSDEPKMNKNNFEEVKKFFGVALKNERITTASQLNEKDDKVMYRLFTGKEQQVKDFEGEFTLDYIDSATFSIECYRGDASEHKEILNDAKENETWLVIMAVLAKTDLDLDEGSAHLLNYLYITKDGSVKSNL